MGVRAAIGAALASAALLWVASPSVGVGWLVWVALVPAAAIALSQPGRPGRLVVPLTYAIYLELLFIPALPFGLAEGQWGDPVVPVLVEGSPVLVVALVLIPLLGAALYAIDLGRPWPRGRLPERFEPALLVIAPALAWTALEVVRVKLEPGGAWGPLYLTQADLPGGSLATLAGPWLITLAVVAVNYALAIALVRSRVVGLAVPAAVAAAVLAITALQAGDDPPDRLIVSAIQPGYDTAEEDRPQLRHFAIGTHDLAALDLIRDLTPLTQSAAARGAELVVWPEATMYVSPRTNRPVRRALEELSERTGAAIVVPYFLRYAGRRSEALAVVPGRAGGSGTSLTGARAKQRPLWFLGERSGGKSASEPLEVAGTRLGLLLGLDAQDPGLAAGLSAAGAELLIAPTHDWPALAVQQRAADRLAARAVDLPLLRVDWRYDSAAYDAGGDTLVEAGTRLRRTVLTTELRPGASVTPYARLGDALAWVALALGCLAILWARAPRLSTPVAAGVGSTPSES